MAGTRTVHRGNRGRFAGSSGGRAETVRVGRGYTRASSSAARPPAKGGRVKRARQVAGTKTKKILSNRKVQAGLAAGAVGIGSRVAYNKLNPATNLKKAKNVDIQGEVLKYGGKSPKTADYTTYTTATHSFTTFSTGKGRKKETITAIETRTKTGKIGQPVGYVKSKGSLLGRTNKVTHSYLTPSQRGKGVGKQALIGHAAHRPNQLYRADTTRSNMGQGLAKSVGAAGRRTKNSKQNATSITKTLDYDFRTSTKAAIGQSGKNIRGNVKGIEPTKLILKSKKVKK